MKRAFVLVAALSVLGLPAAARAQNTSGGVRVGVNLADLAFSPDKPRSDSKLLAGLLAGVFATVPINPVVAFQPELLFSMQGTRIDEEELKAKTKIDYVQVPLLARFQARMGVPVVLLLGPTLGVRTRARIVVPGTPPGFSDGFEDTIERFDVGLVTGAAVDVGRLVLDGRYTWGFRNIWRNADGLSDDTAKHRVLSFSAGVRF